MNTARQLYALALQHAGLPELEPVEVSVIPAGFLCMYYEEAEANQYYVTTFEITATGGEFSEVIPYEGTKEGAEAYFAVRLLSEYKPVLDALAVEVAAIVATLS